MKAPWFPFYTGDFLASPAMDAPGFDPAKHKPGTGPRVHIDAAAFIKWSFEHNLEAADIGLIFKAIAAAAYRKDYDFILAYPWVGPRIYSGTASRPNVSASVRNRVISIGYCAKCGSTENLTVDHIIPYSKGGAHDESNFQCLCFPCNRAKSDKMEVDNG